MEFQFFSLQENKNKIIVFYDGIIILEVTKKCKISFSKFRNINKIKTLISILSDHLVGFPQIDKLHQYLKITPNKQKMEANVFTRYLLHSLKEYGLKDKSPLITLTELLMFNQALLNAYGITPIVKKEFVLWIVWLKLRFQGPCLANEFKILFSLLKYFTGCGFYYFKEFSIFVVLLYSDSSFPFLIKLAIWFKKISQNLSYNIRDKALSNILLTKQVPAKIKYNHYKLMERICYQMEKNNWGGYTLHNLFVDKIFKTHSHNTIGIVLTHCMQGLGDMSLAVALFDKLKHRYKQTHIKLYLFQKEDLNKFQVFEHGLDLIKDIAVGYDLNIKDALCQKDILIYITAPWSYCNGINPIKENIKGKTTIYLYGIDWNRAQSSIRRYPNKQQEIMMPIGISPFSFVSPLEIFENKNLNHTKHYKPSFKLPKQGCLKEGIIYTSYDHSIAKAAVYFLQQMKKHCEQFVYYTFFRHNEFSQDFFIKFAKDCHKFDINYFEKDSLLSNVIKDRYSIINIGECSQNDFNYILNKCTLPLLITGTVTLCQCLLTEKLFIHLGNHPNSKILKIEIENSIFYAFQDGFLNYQEYNLLIKFFNQISYRYQNTDDPFIFNLDIVEYTKASFVKIYIKWIDYLKSRKFSFFKKIGCFFNHKLSSVNKQSSSVNYSSPTFDMIYDNEETNIWNLFRYGVFYCKYTPLESLELVLREYPLKKILTAHSSLLNNPYREKYNFLLGQALNGYLQIKQE